LDNKSKRVILEQIMAGFGFNLVDI